MLKFVTVYLVMGNNKVIEKVKMNDTPENTNADLIKKYHKDLHSELVDHVNLHNQPSIITNFIMRQTSIEEKNVKYDDRRAVIWVDNKDITLYISTDACDDCRKRKRCPCDVTTRVARIQFLKNFCR